MKTKKEISDEIEHIKESIISDKKRSLVLGIRSTCTSHADMRAMLKALRWVLEKSRKW